jgi:hypothetical protein
MGTVGSHFLVARFPPEIRTSPWSFSETEGSPQALSLFDRTISERFILEKKRSVTGPGERCCRVVRPIPANAVHERARQLSGTRAIPQFSDGSFPLPRVNACSSVAHHVNYRQLRATGD